VNDLSMGIPGVGEIHPGMHLCALYSGPDQRDRLLVPFMQEGLRHGDQCVCLIDDLEPASMRQRTYGPAGRGDVAPVWAPRRVPGLPRLPPGREVGRRADDLVPRRQPDVVHHRRIPLAACRRGDVLGAA
jgi:hypothetical protein